MKLKNMHGTGWSAGTDKKVHGKLIRQCTLEVYCFPRLETFDIANIIEPTDRIFFNERLFNRRGDFIERVMRVLTAIFDEIMERQIIKRDPVLHIYCPVVLSHERD